MFMDSAVVAVNELSFDAEVRNSPLPVLVDVSTEWCPPCRSAAPAVAELARMHQGRLKVVAIDGNESPNLAAEFHVRGFPTFLGIVGGRVVTRQAGFGGKARLQALAEELLGATAGR